MDQRTLVDIVCKSSMETLAGKISAVLGRELTCSDIQFNLTSKENLFSNRKRQKTALTRMTVEGDCEGHCYLLTPISAAAILGGTLIMLPEEVIAEGAKSGKLDAELNDAFGEVTDIIVNVFTQVFDDKYAKKLHFSKKSVEELTPAKIDPASDEPFAPGNYYVASGNISVAGKDLGQLEFVVPAAIFDLKETAATDSTPSQATTAAETKPTAATASNSPIAQTLAEPAGTPIILVIGDRKTDTDPFVETLSSAGYDCRVLTFQDEVKELFQQHQILGIFLIMAPIGEKGFAAAIKLQAAGQPLPPVIFAGSEWTRSAVLRAVKYGAKDILVMPASGAEIQDKTIRHIKKAS